MADKEALMYQILGAIYEADAPIVFKSALITKLILAEHGYTTLERQTRDIDANWTDTSPPMSELENTLNRSLESLDEKFHAKAFREYGDKKSAGFILSKMQPEKKSLPWMLTLGPFTEAKHTITARSA